jgi:hypothetical protein
MRDLPRTSFAHAEAALAARDAGLRNVRCQPTPADEGGLKRQVSIISAASTTITSTMKAITKTTIASGPADPFPRSRRLALNQELASTAASHHEPKLHVRANRPTHESWQPRPGRGAGDVAPARPGLDAGGGAGDAQPARSALPRPRPSVPADLGEAAEALARALAHYAFRLFLRGAIPRGAGFRPGEATRYLSAAQARSMAEQLMQLGLALPLGRSRFRLTTPAHSFGGTLEW